MSTSLSPITRLKERLRQGLAKTKEEEEESPFALPAPPPPSTSPTPPTPPTPERFHTVSARFQAVNWERRAPERAPSFDLLRDSAETIFQAVNWERRAGVGFDSTASQKSPASSSPTPLETTSTTSQSLAVEDFFSTVNW